MEKQLAAVGAPPGAIAALEGDLPGTAIGLQLPQEDFVAAGLTRGSRAISSVLR